MKFSYCYFLILIAQFYPSSLWIKHCYHNSLVTSHDTASSWPLSPPYHQVLWYTQQMWSQKQLRMEDMKITPKTSLIPLPRPPPNPTQWLYLWWLCRFFMRGLINLDLLQKKKKKTKKAWWTWHHYMCTYSFNIHWAKSQAHSILWMFMSFYPHQNLNKIRIIITPFQK